MRDLTLAENLHDIMRSPPNFRDLQAQEVWNILCMLKSMTAYKDYSVISCHAVLLGGKGVYEVSASIGSP